MWKASVVVYETPNKLPYQLLAEISRKGKMKIIA